MSKRITTVAAVISIACTLALLVLAFTTRSIAYALPGGYWAGVWAARWQFVGLSDLFGPRRKTSN